MYSSDRCNRYYRSVGVIVRCLVLKQPDCMSLIVEAVMPWPAFNNPVTFPIGQVHLDINSHVHRQRWTVRFQYGHLHGWPLAVNFLLLRLWTVIIYAIEVWHVRINRNGS